jgi:type I restriction enzyme M protein
MSKISYDEINSLLWHAAEQCRCWLQVSQYANYIGKLLYLKRLSDMNDKGETGNKTQIIVPEEARWENLLNAKQNYGDLINNALKSIERRNPHIWNGELTLIDFNDRRLGDLKERDRILSDLIRTFSAISLKDEDLESPDVLGLGFQSFIERIAKNSELQSGDYLTPAILRELLVSLIKPQNGMSIADPVLGSGGFLVESARYVKSHGGDPATLSFSGQEINVSIALMAKLNAFFNNISQAEIKTGDSINSPLILKEGKLAQFDRVIADIPFGTKDVADNILERDPYIRFKYGLPPKSKGEFVFIQHAIAMTNQGGITAVITAPGVLFRGGTEAEIRQRMIEDDIIDTVIALPAGIFFGSALSAAIIVFNRNRSPERKKKILFIDASKKEADKKKGLSNDTVKKIVETFTDFNVIPEFSQIVTLDEIESNEFNLNVSRYVEDSIPIPQIDVSGAIKELESLEERRRTVVNSLFAHYRKLGYTNSKKGERNS